MLQSLLHLFYPKRCSACDNELLSSEEVVCTSCRLEIPETHFHVYNDDSVQKVFYGRIKLENATALFFFEKKGPIQQMLHNLKYRGQKEISTYLGNWLGPQLAAIDNYTDIDTIIPVPMHPKKMRTRGYNQVEGFGKALAQHLHCDYEDQVLTKTTNTKTQVFKNRFLRSEKVLEAFDVVDTKSLSEKHILLVDDIITTGATLEACALALHKIPNIKLSIATMAIAVS